MKLENKVKAVKAEPKSYGHITLNSSDFPGVKELTLGDKKSITVEVDIRALRKPDRWQISEDKMKPDDVIADIKIMGVSLPKKEVK